MKLSAWRVALRIARRDALRAKGRSALVIAMIALPVLGVTGADVIYRSSELTPQEKAVRLMGSSDALVSVYGRGVTVLQPPSADGGAYVDSPRQGTKPTPEQRRSLETDPEALIGELLPKGSVLTPVLRGTGALATSRDGQLRADTAEADLTDPIWRGKLDVVGGRAPSAPQEVAATKAFLDQSGLKLGDTTAVRGLEAKPYTITAVAEYPGELGIIQLIGRPGALIEPMDKALGQPSPAERGGPLGGGSWLVRLPAGAVLDWPAVLGMNKYGFMAASRSVALSPPPRSEVPYYARQDQYGSDRALSKTTLIVAGTAAGMALLEIVLLAGPAFAVGARRSRRQLGLLAAGGGDRSHVRAVVLGGGVVLGLAGAVVGVVLAVLVTAATRPWVEEAASSRFGHFALQPLDLLGVAALGLVTGLLAAVVPAVQASRQDVVEALTGRGSIRRASRRLALVGLLMVAGGGALALFGAAGGQGVLAVLGGSMIAELGVVVCTPMLVGMFGRLGRRLPLSPRLALRDAVRHRGRTAPAVAAVMAAVAGSVAVGIYQASHDQQQRNNYEAALPSGAVVLSLDEQTAAGATVAQSAVEKSVSGLGSRGDVYRTGYGAACATNGGACGYAMVILPKERQCPATDPDNTRLSEAEYNRIYESDPRCQEHHYPRFGPFGALPAGDASVLRNLLGVQDQQAAQALTQGKAVVFDPAYLKDGRITILLTEPSTGKGAYLPQIGADGTIAAPPKPVSRKITVEAVAATSPTPNATALLTPQTAQQLGMTVAPTGSVWIPDAAPSSSAEQRATAALGKVAKSAHLQVERGYQSRLGAIGLALTGFAALVALGAAGIATGLAAADSQRDLATLAAVGANGGIRRRLSGFQCGVIAAMGAAMGAVAGAVPAIALRLVAGRSSTDGTVIAIPWLNIGLTLLVLPALATLLAMLFSRSRLGVLRRTA